MPMVSGRAVYDRGQVKLLEKPPVQHRCEVLVTFLASEPAVPAGSLRAFRDLKGIWSGIHISLEDIEAAKYRTPEEWPPTLD